MKRNGFTLIEILIYTALIGIAGVFLNGTLISVLKLQSQQDASTQVNQQINFVLQNVQQQIRNSSLIDMAGNTASSSLTLRTADPTTDKTLIFLSGKAVYLKKGDSAPLALTTSDVNADQLQFTKITAYPGHDSVQVTIALSYNTQNAQQSFSKTITSAVARVSAATFDSDILPGTDATYSVGTQPNRWKSIFLSGDLTVGNLLTLGNLASDPSGANGGIYYNTTSNQIKAYQNGSWGILNAWTSSGNNISNANSGNVGVGNASPANKLDVSGTTRLNGTLASEAAYDPLNDGLVLYLPFSDNGGTIATDKSRYGNNGTLSSVQGLPFFTTGRIGYGMGFSVDSFISIPDATSLKPTRITVSAWVNPSFLLGSDMYIVEKSAGAGYSGDWLLDITGAHKFRWNISTGSGWAASLDSATTPVIGTWYFVTGTFDGSTVNLYVNGALESSSAVSGSLQSQTNAINIGESQDIQRPFYGTLDEVRIYNRALTGEEINNLLQKIVGTPPGTVMSFAGSTVPMGWLEANGSAISRTKYANLYSAIGTSFGSGDGATTFNIPDLRGQFIRGWDHGAGNDPSAASRTASGSGGATANNVGSKQADTALMSADTLGSGGSFTGGDAGSSLFYHVNDTSPVPAGQDNHPKNIYLMYIIKF